jgi:Ca2+:H+ antiporter
VLGASLLFGGLKNGTQRFDAHTAGINATMMTLAVAALVIPAIFALGEPEHRPSESDIEFLSDGVAVVLIVIYVLYLFYSLFQTSPAEEAQEHHGAPTMRLPVAVGILAVSTIAIVFMSEFLVGALEPTAEDWGMSELFVGVMLVPLVGNVAEHLVAVQVAIANKMDLSLGIAIGSGLQIALFVTPMLVFAGILLDQPMTLVFNSFELTALVAASLIAVLISVDGESNWLEGAELIALYLVIGIAFFFVP